MNLLNSLSLAYQNLVSVEMELGSDLQIISELRQRAGEVTRQILRIDPSNSYVLETAARNLLQDGRWAAANASMNAAEALSYIFQAVGLEGSMARQMQLTKLANEALDALRTETPDEKTVSSASGIAGGSGLVRAWLALAEGMDAFSDHDLDSLPRTNVEKALQILENSGQGNWLCLKLHYDLLAAASPFDFAKQLNMLDQLGSTGYRTSLQIDLEYAILLHEMNRHKEAMQRFRELRRRLKESDAYVSVPKRLAWLLTPP